MRVYADGTVAPRNVDFGLEAGVEGGRYRLSLPSGRYTVCALRVGSERRCRRSGAAATVEEGGTASLDLVLKCSRVDGGVHLRGSERRERTQFFQSATVVEEAEDVAEIEDDGFHFVCI